MSEPRTICVVTSGRCDYGLLHPVMDEIRGRPSLTLQVIATGMHLSPEFGLTYRDIERDGFRIDARVEMLLSSDTPVGTAKSMGLATIGFAEAYDRLAPDLVIVLGDRFELMAAAQAALVSRIPLAHIAGGDTTEGAFDEAIRHSITKMAHLHFVTNEPAAKRVRRMGEDRARVFLTGSPGIDNIRRVPRMSREELEADLGFAFRPRNLLITFHPATLDEVPSDQQFEALLAALDRLGDDVGLIFTLPNADPQGRRLIEMVERYTTLHPNAVARTNLGQCRYYSATEQVDAVVGNSSSGLYETPSFGKPTVNIGDRQRGRLRATSVIDCKPEAGAIYEAIEAALSMDASGTVNPYGDGNSAARIVDVLVNTPNYRSLLKKHFFEEEES